MRPIYHVNVVLLLDTGMSNEPKPHQPHGRVTEFIYASLCELPEGDALSAREIAESALREVGRDPDADRELWAKVLSVFRQQLAELRRRGAVERLGRDRGVK